MEIKLKPFMTPNFVLMELPVGKRGDGFQPDKGCIPISEVPAKDLADLCAQFTAAVFKKAGKVPPPLQGGQEGAP
jgi:hypothetical protein